MYVQVPSVTKHHVVDNKVTANKDYTPYGTDSFKCMTVCCTGEPIEVAAMLASACLTLGRPVGSESERGDRLFFCFPIPCEGITQ